MNLSFTTALHDNATVRLLPPHLSRFMLENVDELEWLLKAACADEQVTAARCLTNALVRGEADALEAQEVLAEIHEVLLNAPTRSRVPEHLSRPDLDAAVRWFGARIEEFLIAIQ